MMVFDRRRYPDVKIKRRVQNNKATLRLSLPARKVSSGKESPGSGDERSVSSVSLQYDDDIEEQSKPPILGVSEIPTLRSYYKSREVQQRDHNYPPNDSYNEIISLVLGDITRLKVDCIVNSASPAMDITGISVSLNRFIHRAAGPGLNEECRRFGRVEAGGVRLTAGYALPSTYVIHTAMPQYTRANRDERNVLSACYRNALKTAMDESSIRTIAFPCLGTGGCGFPSRVATWIALQAVRDFLDAHKEHRFERIIFCAYNSTDEESYKYYLPVYFPPTPDDLRDSTLDDVRDSALDDLSDTALDDVYSSLITQLEDTMVQCMLTTPS
jgi:O-acetyl-ADP-ribose deacetylase (regulator of RNase III)